MKKKLLLAGAVVLMAAAAVTGISANSKSNASALLNANVEALAGVESGGNGGIWLKCAGQSVIVRCKATCQGCGSTWEAFPSSGGPATDANGICKCGHTGFLF